MAGVLSSCQFLVSSYQSENQRLGFRMAEADFARILRNGGLSW
jgi:hypothetical protein